MIKYFETIIAENETTNESGVKVRDVVLSLDKVYSSGRVENGADGYVWYQFVGDTRSIRFSCKSESRMKKEMGNFFN